MLQIQLPNMPPIHLTPKLIFMFGMYMFGILFAVMLILWYYSGPIGRAFAWGRLRGKIVLLVFGRDHHIKAELVEPRGELFERKNRFFIPLPGSMYHTGHGHRVFAVYSPFAYTIDLKGLAHINYLKYMKGIKSYDNIQEEVGSPHARQVARVIHTLGKEGLTYTEIQEYSGITDDEVLKKALYEAIKEGWIEMKEEGEKDDRVVLFLPKKKPPTTDKFDVELGSAITLKFEDTENWLLSALGPYSVLNVVKRTEARTIAQMRRAGWKDFAKYFGIGLAVLFIFVGLTIFFKGVNIF